MELTLVTDCGVHSTKYAGHAKRNRRKDWAEGQVRVMSTSTDTGCAGNELDRWSSTLLRVISKEVEESEELTLVLLVDTFASRPLREALFQLAFEHGGAKKVAMCFTAATALFTAGATSGITVDVGYSDVTITPVDRGVPVTWMATSLGGRTGCAAVDACLFEQLPKGASAEQRYALSRDPHFTLIKSRMRGLTPEGVSVSNGASGAAESDDAECCFTLPDGTMVPLPLNPAHCTAASRRLLYSDTASAPASFATAYQEFAVQFPGVTEWACIGGGAAAAGVAGAFAGALRGCLFGLPDRPLSVRNPVSAAAEGALILTHLGSFKGMCVSAAEYEEDGPSQCVHVKSVDFR